MWYLLVVVKSIIVQHDRREAIRQTWDASRSRRAGTRRGAHSLPVGKASKPEAVPLQQLLAYGTASTGTSCNGTSFGLLQPDPPGRSTSSSGSTSTALMSTLSSRVMSDVFVNPTSLLEFLAASGPRRICLWVTFCIHAHDPIRRKDMKYYIPGSCTAEQLPAYAGGGGFLMAGDWPSACTTAAIPWSFTPRRAMSSWACVPGGAGRAAHGPEGLPRLPASPGIATAA